MLRSSAGLLAPHQSQLTTTFSRTARGKLGQAVTPAWNFNKYFFYVFVFRSSYNLSRVQTLDYY